MEGKIHIDPLMPHVLPTGRINAAFDLLQAGASIRSVAVF